MSFILEKYYFGAILLILVIFLITFISAANVYIKDESRNKNIKKHFTIDIFFVILIISVTSVWYQDAKGELIDKFNSNNSIICRHKEVFIVVNTENNYILKDGYFIKENVAIDINSCKILKD